MPWGKMNIPEPKLLTKLPFESNLRMGSNLEPAQLFVPQRSPTQMLLPSRSMSTAEVEPQVLPAGSFAQPSIVWEGLGGSFTGFMSAWPPSCPAETKNTSANPATTASLILNESSIATPPDES